MTQAKSPADIIRLPTFSTPDEKELEAHNLQEQFIDVKQPSDLDTATKGMNKPASLLNFHFATTVDLSLIGLGQAVYIPVQVTDREGGRKSIFFLRQEDGEVLTGIFVTREGIALRFMKRVFGSSLPAQPGDVYSTRITDRTGKNLIFEGEAKLRAFNPPREGWGHFNDPENEGTTNTSPLEISSSCYVWSIAYYQPGW
ncbi:MAG: hypothetical protein ACJ8CB_26050 [Ktedonobacteraceae bacterium]